MDCTEDVEISELYDIYNSSNHEVDNFVTGEFSNPYSSMYENFREKLEDEVQTERILLKTFGLIL